MTLTEVIDLLTARKLIDRVTQIGVQGDYVTVSLEPRQVAARKASASEKLSVDEKRAVVESVMYASADE